MICACGVSFETSTKAKAKSYCSRSCASRFSMNDARREAQRKAGAASKNRIDPVETLRKREAWKYVLLKKPLQGRKAIFEFPLGGFVFDLALLDIKVLVEFDGPYHGDAAQQERDELKELTAKKHGFKLERRAVKPATVIGPETLAGL